MPKSLVKSKIKASDSKKLYESKINPALEKNLQFYIIPHYSPFSSEKFDEICVDKRKNIVYHLSVLFMLVQFIFYSEVRYASA